MSTIQKTRAESPNHPFRTEHSKRVASERLKGKTFEEVYGEKAQAIKDKMSAAKKGRPVWNKGVFHSEATKRAMSEAQRGKPRPYMKGMVSSVDPHGIIVRLPKDEFDARPDLVGIMSTEGKKRRSIKTVCHPPTDD